MVRVTSQEMYDELVTENMFDFEMTPEEAIQDAISQFQAQGVDLTNIIKDLVTSGYNEHLVSITMRALKGLCGSDYIDYEEVTKQLEILKSECKKDLARRMRAAKEGAYRVLIELLHSRQKMFVLEMSERDIKLAVVLLETLEALMDGQPDLMDDKALELIKSILDNMENGPILVATLKWTGNCCVKHEANRQKLIEKIAENLKSFLKVKGDEKLVLEALQVMRKLTLDDDVRVQCGKAHEHARELALANIDTLTLLLKENIDPPLCSELMSTLASLLVRNELCKMAAENGVPALFAVLAENYNLVGVTQQACKLITALAGNDDVKRDLVKSGIVPIIVSVLTKHANNPSAAALIMKCIAALVLREPTHSVEFMENGVAEAIVQCMKLHPDKPAVQQNACWAIRNLVARCREQNVKFHELGVEGLLQVAYARFSYDFGFDIKSALRDLECDVKLEEPWTGRGVQLDQ